MPIERVRLGPQLEGGVGGDAERVVLGHDTAPAAEGGHRRVQLLGQRAHGVASVLRPAADHDHRPLGGCQQLGGGLHLQRRRRGRLRHGSGAQRLDVGAGRHRVPRHLHRHRAWPPRQHLPERLVEDLRRVGRALDARGPFRQRAQGGELVGQLVQVATAAAEEGRRDLPRDQQHRRATPVRGAQRGRGVEDAGPRHHREHARPTRRARVAERHVAARLLVPGADRADLVAALLQRVEQRVKLRARQAEHRVDVVGDQRLDDRHAAGHGPGLGLLPHALCAPSRGCPPAPEDGAPHLPPSRGEPAIELIKLLISLTYEDCHIGAGPIWRGEATRIC